MHAQLMGYLLGALEPDEHLAVAEQLTHDPNAQRDLETLKRGLELLKCDAEAIDPPPGLAHRACRFAEDHAEKPCLAPVSDGLPSRGGWSWHDISVFTGIVAAALLLFVPAINHGRQQARRNICQNHERQIGVALQQFAQQQSGFFPRIATSGPLAFTGMYAVQLKEGGFLTDDRAFLCPCCRLCEEPRFAVPSEEELRAASSADLAALRLVAGGSFGYPCGYIEENQYRDNRHQGRPAFAILSDSPNPKRKDRCSERHGSCGQNVLFDDLHVSYVATATVGPNADNIFVNTEGEVSPGTNADDAVIIPPAELLTIPLRQAD